MKSLKAKFRKTDTNEWNKNDERLLAAVEHGEVDKVTSLLAKKGSSAVKLDSEGKSALLVAAARGLTECLEAILSHGADLLITDAAGLGPLHLAAKNNHVECCKKLIQSKCPVDGTDSSGKTALHHAAASGSVQTVQLLCEHKSLINIKDADGLTPLLISSKHGHAEVCSILLECGAELDATDTSGRTAVILACETNSATVMNTLAQHGANLLSVDSQGQGLGHYGKLFSSSELKSALAKTVSGQQVTGERNTEPLTQTGPKPMRISQHDQVTQLPDERITTPKKRKAPPPPISQRQDSEPSSPSNAASTGTPAFQKSDTPEELICKEVELRRMSQKELQDERILLLDTVKDFKKPMKHTGTETEKDDCSLTASSALVSALQAKVTTLSLENQQLKGKHKQYLSEELQDSSRPNSLTSNSSFHSTQDELEVHPSHTDKRLEEDTIQRGNKGSKEEICLLRQALDNVQVKLFETRKENRSLQAQLHPERLREEDEGVRDKGREAELMESLAELQAKLTDTQERYHQALEEVEELRALTKQGHTDEKQEDQRRFQIYNYEIKKLRSQLLQSESQKEKFIQQVIHLEEALRRAENKCNGKDKDQQMTQIEGLYKEAQEEIRILQEALKGTVPVDAAAKDFEEMKSQLNKVISGLQMRLLELSHSYSETKSQLSVAQKQLADNAPFSSTSEHQEDHTEVLKIGVEELQASLSDMEMKYSDARQEISRLHQESEKQMAISVSLTEHTQVVASLGNAIKDLENQIETLKEQLRQRTQQVDALQERNTVDKTFDDSVLRAELETMKEQLDGEVKHLTQLLQAALRKQDEMALEAADAWQQARDNCTETEALQELVLLRDKENWTLTSRLIESQDAVSQLKQLVENYTASEREKNKRIDDLSREVCKLKDALNSLSQLSYNSSSPTKRQQQNHQVDMMQHQIYELQYQLAESKKQHHEIVSVYRMHLLYAVQGQMDEDVQKALKQILLMCKMPGPAKEAC